MRQHGREGKANNSLPHHQHHLPAALSRCLRSEELPLILTIVMDSNEVAETGHFSLSTAVDLMDSEASLSTL
jgi:hypothetical protein